MDRNLEHYVVVPGTVEWWGLNASLLLGGLLVFVQSAQTEERIRTGRLIAMILIANVIGQHLYFANKGVWTMANNLPLQLCAMSELLAITFLLTKSQMVYELLIFWSAGAIHAFITPELTHGYGIYELIIYAVSHGGVIVVSFYATWYVGMTPRKWSFFKVFLLTQLCLPLIGLVNWLTGGNYMYLAQKPGANNPFIIGEWPWYIVSLELVVLVHFFLFYRMHLWVAKLRDKRRLAKQTV